MFVEFTTKVFGVAWKFLKWGISHKLPVLIRQHSYLDHGFLGRSASLPWILVPGFVPPDGAGHHSLGYWVSMTRRLNLKTSRSLWPIFYGPVILPYIFKTIWCMNIVIWDYESVWHEVWPQNKYRSLWPILNGPVILRYILKTIWCVNIIIWDYGSVWPDVWPKNKCMSVWPIFNGPVICLISPRLFDAWMSYFQIRRQCDPNFDIKGNISQHDLYFMV